jgi:hypothetical protein
VFQYTVTAALLGSYMARRTAFLPSTGGQGAGRDQQSDEELGQHQCCRSGMFIPDPDFYPSRIPDLGSRIHKQQQKRGVKKNLFVITFYVATNFAKLQIILVLKW